MTTAVYLLLYGALVTWSSPPLLTRLTKRGLSPRLGVAAWVTALAAVLLAWVVAIALIVVTGLNASSTLVLCLEILGLPERVATPAPSSVALLVGGVLVISTTVTVNVGRAILAAWRRTREHAHAARIIGVPTGRPDVFVVTAARPAAYCVAGRPNAIVVTSAAVDGLDDAQLAAVLAHEEAHIAGRHHHLLMVLRALAATLPRLPLFSRGATAIAELFEMCADDAAVRRHGAGSLVTGMIALAGAPPPRVGGLAVASTAVAARAARLLKPAPPRARVRHRMLVSATMAFTVAAPIVINVLCHH